MSDEQARSQERVALAKFELIQKLGLSGIRAAAAVLCAYFAYKGLASLAGQSTSFTAIVQAIVDLKVSEYAAWAITAMTSFGFVRERRLRVSKVKELSSHITILETQIDPQRTSSGLTGTGQRPKLLGDGNANRR